MDIRIKQYQFFFSDQIKAIEDEYRCIATAPMYQLINQNRVTIGYADHIDENRHHLILRIPKRKAPRLKVKMAFVAVSNTAKSELGQSISDWSCTFVDFLENGKYHTPSSDLFPLYYKNKVDFSYDYIGCSGVELNVFEFFKKSIAKGKQITVLIYSPLPPTAYFSNLNNFLSAFHDLPQQLIEPKIEYDEWKPEELAYNSKQIEYIPMRVMETLDTDGVCVVQGPPGTGKSYTIAHIIAKYLAEQKNVCITTMTNKGLIELIQQPPLKPFLENCKISKTNLTADEHNNHPNIKSAKKNFIVSNGELLCSTNYVLSNAYNKKNILERGLPIYDLIIIEEASQAFLASILAFKELGKKCLIVGDPMQLPPIVLKPNKNQYKAWNANNQIEGLKAFALGTDVKSFQITTSFRLTLASASLTKEFYSNNFTSVSEELLDFSKCNSPYFIKDGGVIYQYTASHTDGIISDKAKSIISEVVNKFMTNYLDRTLGIISPFNDTVKELQSLFSIGCESNNLIIETIDRIQGMTVDYTIFYIPGRNVSFALDEKRFNVATSRSRSTTLIISDTPLTDMYSATPKITNFLRKCKVMENK